MTKINYPPIREDVKSDAVVESHREMLKNGMIRQMSQGLFTIMPRGMQKLHQISQVIREETEKIGGLEVMFPIIQMNDIWIKSGRAEGYCGPETLRMKDRHDRDMLFSPTAEESATLVAMMDVQSYKQLPLNLFQINWKFRDEMRPRFGLLRCREFLMFDGYSFDLDEEAARKTYSDYFFAYLRIFARLGLKAIPMQASSGEIGGDLSHEFQIIAEYGESSVYYDKKLDAMLDEPEKYTLDDFSSVYAKADDEHNPATCPVSSENLVASKGIEVGHIFYFGDKYTKPLGMKVQGKDGKLFHPVGGSYGIGVTRVLSCLFKD